MEKKEQETQEVYYKLLGESGNVYELKGTIDKDDYIYEEMIEMIEKGGFCAEGLRVDLEIYCKGERFDQILEKIVAISY